MLCFKESNSVDTCQAAHSLFIDPAMILKFKTYKQSWKKISRKHHIRSCQSFNQVLQVHGKLFDVLLSCQCCFMPWFSISSYSSREGLSSFQHNCQALVAGLNSDVFFNQFSDNRDCLLFHPTKSTKPHTMATNKIHWLLTETASTTKSSIIIDRLMHINVNTHECFSVLRKNNENNRFSHVC